MRLLKVTFALAISCLSFTSAVHAVEIGPAPTSAILNGNGSFAVSTATVSSSVAGFGGGTIYYPTTAGSYGVIAVCPGFTESQSAISWFARRLATHGFVTIAMNTDSSFDNPSSRATQLRAALNYMVNSSTSAVRSRIDPSRRGVSGHSMGGGGTLIASTQDSTLKVGIPMAPYNTSNPFASIQVPTMIFGADGDSIAPVASHARPFYAAIPNTTKKAYAELNNANHSTSNSTDERVGRYGVAFAKRFVDGDTRYSPFLCGSEHTAYATTARFDRYQQNCPY